jgi:hypothetical protein
VFLIHPEAQKQEEHAGEVSFSKEKNSSLNLD